MDVALASKPSPSPSGATIEQPISKRDKAIVDESSKHTNLNPNANDAPRELSRSGALPPSSFLTEGAMAMATMAPHHPVPDPFAPPRRRALPSTSGDPQPAPPRSAAHGRRGRGVSVSTPAAWRRPSSSPRAPCPTPRAPRLCLDPDASTVDTTILGLDDVRAKEMPYIASMGIYVFSKDVMLQLLREQFPGANDFGSEVIPRGNEHWKEGMLGSHLLEQHLKIYYYFLQVQAYLYDGYWEDIGTIEAFYNANLGITKKPIPDFSFYDRSAPIYTQPRHLPPSKVLDADVTDSVIGEGCVIKNCKIHHSVVVGLRSCISEGAIIEDTLLMGADYYETEADKKLLAETGGIPIGIGKNSHIRRAIIDKNARIGDNVKIINVDNVQEAARETDGYFIKGGIVTVIKDALLPSGTVI
ncbi:hypothetical protein HU200_047676 [Digitaria exilis]|uniref:glucose-1-phosphate adenylyltransferase n=1 Tax=Digitaria exilis TaxID=1010633 RepID=A0A835AXS4_9POAL|nr:hypothetical protein HU200_047676 [Digitaria exilis]